MARFTTALLLLASLASVATAQTCTGNGSMCPNNQDGVSPTYLQCDSSSGQYVTMNCESGQVCYANPTNPGTAMCGLPGTGGSGSCTGNVAKCVSPGQTGAYLQCQNWSGQYVNANCPSGLKCYNNASNTGVYCN
ncbi:hypothetical protein GQ54DRAFT_255719 [Martensiomyces pterosporus]|nr:hypothetical protein GQ54DRAFT_255719 [Martensiomyces pterosporus]